MPGTASSVGFGRQRLIASAVALAGVLFTAAAGLGGADALCLTQGCSLYQDVQLLGFSLWWWGAGAFAMLLGLCLAGWLQWAFWLSLAAVAIDCVFLFWMAVSMPCINCLVGALLFFALFVTLAASRRTARLPALAVGVLWLTLFTPNIFAAGQEIAGPWNIAGADDAPVRVYFSPSCPSCREALKGLLMGGEDSLAFYPVAENEEDVKRLANLRREIAAGASFVRAFAASRDPEVGPEPGFMELLSLRAGLFRNRMALSRMGADRIPVIVMHGIPRGFGERGLAAMDSRSGLGDKDGFSGCTQLGNGATDCDKPQDSLTIQ